MFANQAPALWSCADKMMTCLFFQAGRPDGRGIRPRSLNVATISVSMTEVIKGRANLSQLAIQGNYRAAATHDMDKVYSRNFPNRKIFVSQLGQKILRKTKTPSLP